jgi:hypothetical protein
VLLARFSEGMGSANPASFIMVITSNSGSITMKETQKYSQNLMVTPQGFKYVIQFNDESVYLTVRGVMERSGILYFTGANPLGSTVALQ